MEFIKNLFATVRNFIADKLASVVIYGTKMMSKGKTEGRNIPAYAKVVGGFLTVVAGYSGIALITVVLCKTLIAGAAIVLSLVFSPIAATLIGCFIGTVLTLLILMPVAAQMDRNVMFFILGSAVSKAHKDSAAAAATVGLDIQPVAA